MPTHTKIISVKQAIDDSCQYQGLFTIKEYDVTHIQFTHGDSNAEYICSAKNAICPGGLSSMAVCRTINK